jgi:very-short-patch-repair endonuclease
MPLLTEEKIKTKVEEHNFQYIENSCDRKNYKISVICPENHTTSIIYHSFLTNINKCSKCPRNVNSQNKLTIDFVKQEFEKRKFILLSTVWEGYEKPLYYICSNNHNATMSYATWKTSERGCKECNNLSVDPRKLSYEFVKEQFENKGFQLVSTNYICNAKNLDIICNMGHKGQMTYANFRNEHACIECSGSKTHTLESVSKILHEDGYVLLSDSYKNNKTRLQMKCSKNHRISIRFDSFVCGKRCGVCNESKGETAIKKHLTELKLSYLSEYTFDECKDINKLPFDIYVNNQFLIEFDGIQHFEYKENDFFGGENAYEKRQYHDLIKTVYCCDNKMSLLRISYKEFKNIPQIIDQFIANLEENQTLIHFSNDKLYEHLI